jgi:hypothetical protein
MPSAGESPSSRQTVPQHGDDTALDAPRIDHPTSIAADLTRLLTELDELSARTRTTSTQQRDRTKEIGPTCITIRSK